MTRLEKGLTLAITVCCVFAILSIWQRTVRGQADDLIYYVSCLHNGVGPDIDITPFAITDAVTLQRSVIPVGT